MNTTKPLQRVFEQYFLLRNNRKGLSSPVINWIFVMVAGAVILLFIFKIIASQSEITELEVSSNLLEDMGSVLVGRSVSDNSFTEINVPKDKLFLFKCNGFCNPNTGCNSYVKSLTGDKQIETKVRPIFTAEKIKFTNKIYSFVESWKVPFNVVNFVYLTYPGQKFVFPQSCSGDCSRIYNQIPSKIKTGKIVVNDPSNPNIDRAKFVKYVYFNNCNNNSVDSGKRSVCIDSSKIYFYNKNGIFKSSFNYLTDEEILGAIFTENAQTYECNMRKAQYKYENSLQIYQDKINHQYSYNKYGNCANFYGSGSGEISTTLSLYKINPDDTFFNKLNKLSQKDILQKVELLNRKLMRNDCSPIY